MTHLKNIAKLFNKNFVESPLIETFDAGKIHFSTGKIVACDPLITNDMAAFKINFPQGDFPVVVHKERESNCIAYVEIVFSDAQISEWKLATTEGQDIDELKGEEIFGIPLKAVWAVLWMLKLRIASIIWKKDYFTERARSLWEFTKNFSMNIFLMKTARSTSLLS